jgi:hypothetical protein
MKSTVEQEPKPECNLTESDGNAFAIMGQVTRALRRAGCSQEHIAAYQREATSGDYDNLLRVSMEYVDVT